jgi:hypothetical protein
MRPDADSPRTRREVRHRSRATGLLAVASIAFCLVGCPQAKSSRTGVSATVVPQPLTDADGRSVSQATAPLAESGAQRPRISIDPGDTILQVINANLDDDGDQEQLIAVKRADDLESPVRIIVADADPSRGTYYYQSWDSPTNATDSRVFSLSVKDLVGDHDVQIVASGMTASGKLSLDVFRQLPPEPGKGLIYHSICQLVADDISIEESRRTDSYASSDEAGPSFPIVAYLLDPESQNARDLVRFRYAWNSKEDRYVPGAVEKIPGEKAQAVQLEKLYNNVDEAAFEDFISGSWVQIQSDPAGKKADVYLQILDFDTLGRKISLASGDTQEVYLWRQSHRTIYNRMLVIGENEAVKQIARTFSIGVDSVDGLTVTIVGSESGEMPSIRFSKVTDAIRARLLERPEAQVSMSSLALSGLYEGTDDLSISFNGNEFTWIQAGSSRSGSFVLFSLGTRSILSVRLQADRGAGQEVLSWLLDYSEKKSATRVTRTLNLSPVLLTVKGYEDAIGDALRLEQSQEIKKN